MLFRVTNALHLSYPPTSQTVCFFAEGGAAIAAMASEEITDSQASAMMDEADDGAKTPPQIARAPSEPEPAFLRSLPQIAQTFIRGP